MPVWQESILLLAVALGLAVLIKALFVQAFYIPSESMEPGLVKNDRILVQKVSYWFGGNPSRGDVVVFEDPGSWLATADSQGPTGFANLLSKVGLYPTGGHLVKRVIGTEGDVIVCCDEQGRIEVNGKAIDEEDYVRHDSRGCDGYIEWVVEPDSSKVRPCSWTIGPVPKGKLFVMGDNREHSADSRAHLCSPDEDPCTQSPWVDRDLVVGKVFTLIWPRDRWRWISRPEVFDDVPGSPSDDLVEKAEKVGVAQVG
ncbi:signal peptidase I [Nocardioides aromaticivorans]|uniref:Signal peptidase I n=1 Tax=Nocardioides aromaticivorans TaxID=200618 RepID=A0ABX7PMW0_9ACTN|nr:signal peptidase I [Nocardioides aromaticivorans]